MTERVRRRRFVAGVGAAVASLAGCAESGDSEAESPTETDKLTTAPPATGTDGSPTATRDATDTTTETAPGTTDDEDDLDLREANVVDVALERRNGSIRFDVTLYHDDDGEDGYANWWQVEAIGGEQLGRRELLHAHSTAPFTRSETIELLDDVTCVVVRGHDQTHGYGGQAAIVNLESEKMILVRQGAERRSFDAADCP